MSVQLLGHAVAAASERNKNMVSPHPRPDAAANETADASGSTPDGAGHNHRSVDPQKARQGQIILRTPTQRWIFFVALGLAAVLGILIAVLA